MITTLFLAFAIQLSFSGEFNHDTIIGGGGGDTFGGGDGVSGGGGGRRGQRSISSLNHRNEKKLENRSALENMPQASSHAERGDGFGIGEGRCVPQFFQWKNWEPLAGMNGIYRSKFYERSYYSKGNSIGIGGGASKG